MGPEFSPRPRHCVRTEGERRGLLTSIVDPLVQYLAQALKTEFSIPIPAGLGSPAIPARGGVEHTLDHARSLATTWGRGSSRGPRGRPPQEHRGRTYLREFRFHGSQALLREPPDRLSARCQGRPGTLPARLSPRWTPTVTCGPMSTR
jgi:hypothetical protein